MKTIEIHGQSGMSTIAVGESLNNLENYFKKEKTVIITDQNVNRLYGEQFPPWPVITIGLGEKIKTLKTVEHIYKKLIELEIDRSCCLVGIGGGIVCDIAGFVASTYMRGLRFGFASSSLLSQVDAGVGGKNGVNFSGYKNMVGVFSQPEFVICDPVMLKTLPGKELYNGFAEIIKNAVIDSSDLFSFLEENYRAALNLDEDVIERLVYDSANIKAYMVNRDEKERGERRKLNFGHTFGHGVEKTTGISHGEAVGIGMIFAANLSVKKGLLSREEADRLTQLLKKVNLPTKIRFDKKKIIDALRKDKKREGEDIHFVLLKALGEAVIEEISIEKLEELVHAVC
jgi:3-dehydroquinate synthase